MVGRGRQTKAKMVENVKRQFFSLKMYAYVTKLWSICRGYASTRLGTRKCVSPRVTRRRDFSVETRGRSKEEESNLKEDKIRDIFTRTSRAT